MGVPVVHFEINSRDLKKSVKFYNDLFRWKIKEIAPINYGLINTGSKKGIQGGIGQVNPGQTPSAIFYVAVEDPRSYLDKAVSLGGKVIQPVTEIPGMVTFAHLSDPDGTVIGLVDSAGPPPKTKAVKAGKKKKRGQK